MTSGAMGRLGSLTSDIRNSIPQGARVGYVDYPMHVNVGDLLIFLGAMDFFNWNCNEIPHSFCLYDANSRAMDSLQDVDVIACHGGGNFGDIYPRHQKLREQIVRSFPDKPIVIMPQSFHFSSEVAMGESARIFAAHDNVTIYVRDEASFEIARNRFSDKVFYSPDMAHRLYGGFASVRERIKTNFNSAEAGEFFLMRRDVEADPQLSGDMPSSFDWKDIMRFSEKLRMERHRTTTRVSGMANRPAPQVLFGYHKTVRGVIEAISMRIGGYNPWSTSRLHGAIMGLLLDRDVTLYDNSYGKNSRYFSKWGPELVRLKQARDFCREPEKAL